jgi:DNA-binding response OmpR family regulator
MSREELIEECAWHRAERESERQNTTAANIAVALGLSPNQSRLLALLYAENGRTVSRQRAFDCAVHLDDSVDDWGLLRSTVSLIRKRTFQSIILPVRGLGYRITENGKTFCDAALARLDQSIGYPHSPQVGNGVFHGQEAEAPEGQRAAQV